MNKFTGIALVATCITAGPLCPTFGQGPAPAVAPMAPQPLFAGNLGIVYVPISFNNGTFGLRLTRAPLPGSPASQLPLDAGDVVFALDGQRFANANDVANHVGLTAVDFVRAATNTLHRGNINLPAAGRPQPPSGGGGVGPVTPGAPMVANAGNQFGQPTNAGQGRQSGRPAFEQGGPRPQLARNLGIFFVPIRLGDGTLGLRLTRAPLPGSPASQLPLDAGDIILALDGQRVANANDVASHVNQTTVDFIDARTNTLRRGNVNLPSATGPPQSLPGGAAGAPMAANAGNQFGQPTNAGQGQQSGQPAFAQDAPRPQLARNLGIFYVPIRLGDGTLGLRLTRAPLPGSPASQLPLDAGDIILALDGQRFANPSDVANHFDQTTVDFLDAGTNTLQNGTINLPSQTP